jgi:YHS domain-containing protein
VRKLLLAILVIGLSACSRDSGSPSQAASQPQAAHAAQAAPSAQATQTTQAAQLPSGLTRVADPSQVCMVNDQYMGRPQIPTVVEGRTYYGCCAMCKEKLEKQREARIARDPVSGEEVDKATAVIAQDTTGKALYFASEDTLRRYGR